MTLAGSNATGPADPPSGMPATLAEPMEDDRRAMAGLRLGPAAAARCRRRVHLDADPDAPRSKRSVADDGLRLRLAEGDAHRLSVVGLLRRSLGVPPTNGADDVVPSTHVADRPAVVFEPALRSDTRFGTPDLLLWSSDGYVPVIVRSHRTTDPGSGALVSTFDRPLTVEVDLRRRARAHSADALALAHHYRLLAELGLAASVARGGVIGRGVGPETGADDGASIIWHELDLPDGSVLADYDRRFADRLAVAAAAATGRPALAVASRIGECSRCSWWPLCSADLLARKDISLIAAGGDVDLLHAAGIRTVDDLARMDRSAAAALPLTAVAPGTARVRARAWLAGLPLVRKRAEILVRRADIELDVDMESFLEDGAYLWGTYLTGDGVRRLGVEPGYRAFVTWRPLPDKDEGRAFAEFWAYLTSLRSSAASHGLTFAAYCYSRSAEERWLRSTPIRYPDVPGMPGVKEISEFCASSEWVDIYQEIRDQFVVPGSMKLKALAPIAGFSWRDPEPGGENSMAWYRAAVGAERGEAAVGRHRATSDLGGSTPGPRLPVDQSMADRILRYNEDDVLATLALRRWMTERADKVPTVRELDAD